MVTIHAYRHPPIANPTGICYGRHDIALAADWQDAARAQGLSPASFASPRQEHPLCFSSPASRALRLATWLWPTQAVCIDDRLHELDFGAWEGRPWSEISPQEVEHWQQDLWRHSAPSGESVEAMNQRVEAFLHDLQQSSKPCAKTVLLVTHHGILKLLMGKALSLTIQQLLDVSVPFATKVSFQLSDDGRTLHSLNKGER